MKDTENEREDYVNVFDSIQYVLGLADLQLDAVNVMLDRQKDSVVFTLIASFNEDCRSLQDLIDASNP